MNRQRHGLFVFTCLLAPSGCGDIFAPAPAPLFTTPIEIETEPIGQAIIDTGGGYELMLRDEFGLKIVDTVEVLAFGGIELVGLTEGFVYSAGGLKTEAQAALVGLSVCDCNGLGFHFFRKTGAVLGLDFQALSASFMPVVPVGGVTLPFQPAPPELSRFDSAFIQVQIETADSSITVTGLLDTGTNTTALRRGLVEATNPLTPDRADIFVLHPDLGKVAVNVRLFDTRGLPDIILGTDIMRAWSDRWYFFFARQGGTVTAFPRYQDTPPPDVELIR